MFCNECGTPLPDDTQFCPNCGKKVINTTLMENVGVIPPRKRTTIILCVGGTLLLIAAVGISIIAGNRSSKKMANEADVQDIVATQETTGTDTPQTTVSEPEQKTSTDREYPFYAASLITLFNEQTLPNERIVKYISDPENNPLQFAIYDINRDGKDELLFNLSSAVCEISGHFIYIINTENTGIEDLCRFNEDTTYYETGFIKEPISSWNNLSESFNSYDIRMWDAAGFLDAGRVEAWEKLYMPNDSLGNPFPDSIDIDGNGIVYFISGELGIDYENSVDDAEYKEYEKQFFGDGKEISIPWLDLTLDNIEKNTGYTKERLSNENITLVYTGEIYDDTQLQSEEDLPEMLEQIPYVPLTATIIGEESETFLNNIPYKSNIQYDSLTFVYVLPIIKSPDDTTYYGYFNMETQDYYVLGIENGYITTYSQTNITNIDMNSSEYLLDQYGVNGIEPFAIRREKKYDYCIWRYDNAYLIITGMLHDYNGKEVLINVNSITLTKDLNFTAIEQILETQ